MVELIDIISYILKNYPHKTELSNARLTKMIYLIDWRSAFDYGEQITNINWYFDNYGPFVHDVEDVINNNSGLIKRVDTYTIYGTKKTMFLLKNEDIDFDNLSENVTSTIDIIIEKTKRLYWKDFIDFVYSTYPIVTSERYTFLNLIKKAEEYKKELLDDQIFITG